VQFILFYVSLLYRSIRFGFRYLDVLLELQGRTIEVVNWAADGREDLLDDLVAIIDAFCARLYGQRRAKRKAERVRAELRQADDAES
jgi:putative resolvase